MKIRNIKYESDILEIGMKFQMRRPNQQDVVLVIVSFTDNEDGYIDVNIKQEGTENSQVWRRYPKRKCALEFELNLATPKGQKIINLNPVS